MPTTAPTAVPLASDGLVQVAVCDANVLWSSLAGDSNNTNLLATSEGGMVRIQFRAADSSRGRGEDSSSC
jgi:hypothetical protein